MAADQTKPGMHERTQNSLSTSVDQACRSDLLRRETSLALLHQATKVMRLLLAIATGGYIALFVGIAVARIHFPFELEWMEGSLLVEVQRLAAGAPAYTRPSLEYVPLVYTPLYFYLSAAMTRLCGGGFFPLRLVSFCSTLGVMAVIYLWVSKETRRKLLGWISVGFFAACYNLNNTWFDLARVDMLFLFTLLLGAFSLRFARSYGDYLLAGLSFSLSFLTKQTALVFFLPLVCFAIRYGKPRYVLAMAGWITLVIGGTTILLNTLSQGWYSYTIIQLPVNHTFSFDFAVYYLLGELLPSFGIIWLILLVWLIQSRIWKRASLANAHPSVFTVFFFVVCFGGSWVARANRGGDVNGLIPVCAGLAVLVGLALGNLSDAAEKSGPVRPQVVLTFVSLALLAQFAVLAYNPFTKIPSASYLAAGNALVEDVRGIDGAVFIPDHNYIALLAGKPAYAHSVPIEELAGLFGSHPQDSKTSDILRDLDKAVNEKEFAAIILDGEDKALLPNGVEGYQKNNGFVDLQGVDIFFSVSPYKQKTQLNVYTR